MNIQVSSYGKLSDGQSVDQFELSNSCGHKIRLINYGAIITGVDVPDRDGKLANVNLDLPDLAAYEARHPYFGSTVGRFCNRIARGRFTLDGTQYEMVVNNGPNHLHGGTVGFDKLMWRAEQIDTPEYVGVRFETQSPHGQEGYPGNLTITAEYTWNDRNELSYTFRATTDQATVINMTNHSYWNLSGSDAGDILKHQVQIPSEHYLAVDDTLIPTGEYAEVAATPLDFRVLTAVGNRIAELPNTKGYDHCYVVPGTVGDLRLCGTVIDSSSGRRMDVLTTQPGVQFYTGNHLSEPYPAHSGLCLETQHYPDSPNQPAFPSTRLDPGQQFQETTVHTFSVEP